MTAEASATFQTLAPSATVSVSVFPNSGLTLGVGQPIDIRFSEDITSPAARASLLNHLSVTESDPSPAAGTGSATAAALPAEEALADRRARDGRLGPDRLERGRRSLGAGQRSEHFRIGHARVSYADLATHLMTVTDNGRMVATYPISGGKPTDPTMGGVHIVLDRAECRADELGDERRPGELTRRLRRARLLRRAHLRQRRIRARGAVVGQRARAARTSRTAASTSVPTDAAAFFAFSRVGDVVRGSGSPRPPVFGDHGVMDWSTSWAEFTPAKMPVRNQIHAGRF